MSVSDRAEAVDGIMVGKDYQTKAVNSTEKLTLADQFQFMGNQVVTRGLTELVEETIIKPTRSSQVQMMFISFGMDVNLMRSSWEMNQSQGENIRNHGARKYTEKGLLHTMSILEERRKQLKKRIFTQSGEINEMLNSHQHYVTVKEEMIQLGDKFEILISEHEMLELRGGSNKAPEMNTFDQDVLKDY